MTYKIMPEFASRDEWLEFRRLGIGSSEAACIMGCALYEPDTWLKLFRSKFDAQTEREITPPMRRGIGREPHIRQRFEDITGYKFPSAVLKMDGFPAVAQIDGISTYAGQKAIAEFKSTHVSGPRLAAARKGDLMPHDMAQVQHQLMVSGANVCHFVVEYDTAEGLIIVPVLPNIYYHGLLLSEINRFWEYVIDFTPPEPTDKDIRVRYDGAWRMAVDAWRETGAALKKAEEAESVARGNLIALAKDELSQGEGVRVSRHLRKGNVQYDNVPELKGVDLEPYRKPGSWTNTIREIKG